MFQNELHQIDAKTPDGKRHLPTVLRLVTDAISKLRQKIDKQQQQEPQ
jgi:hypothetical protein